MFTIISGTNRPGSNALRVAREIEKIYRAQGEPVEILDLLELPAEIFHPSSYAAKPAGFERFARSVTGSSGLVVVTPEYNGSFPGVLKYFIDMLPFPESFQSRPVCFVGLAAGQWGALRSIEQLQMIFSYRNAHLFPQRVFIPAIHDHLSEDGNLKTPEIHQRLRGQAEGFIRFARSLQGAG